MSGLQSPPFFFGREQNPMAFEPSGIAPEASGEVMEVCHSKVFGRQRQANHLGLLQAQGW